jgi:hypothetical protein
METTLSPVTTSKQFSLKLNDFWKGFIMFVGTPVLYAMQELIPHWHIGAEGSTTDVLVKAAISAAITYLLKNYLTPSSIVVKDPAAVKAVEAGDAELTMKH